jgi:hypothetical protein
VLSKELITKRLKKSRVLYILLAFVCTVNVSCRQPVENLALPDKDGAYTSGDSYAAIFDTFWQGMNNNYVYWSIEPLDYWDRVYDEFKPRFRALGNYSLAPDPQSERNRKLAYNYFIEFLSPLRDGHMEVNFDPALNYPLISANDNRVFSRPGARDVKAVFFASNWSGAGDPDKNNNYNFWKNTINSTKYIAAGTGFDSYENPPAGSGTQITDPDLSLRVATGHIDPGSGDYILYLYFNEFSMRENKANQAITGVVDKFYSDLTADPHVKGLIVDLRGNMGGDELNVWRLIGSLIQEPLCMGYTRVKNGPGRLDYQPWVPLTIYPQDERIKNPEMPVVIIASDMSISCSELTTMAVKALPGSRGHVVGTMTYGAVGWRMNNIDPTETNGGPFTGNKFWTQVTQAASETRSINGENYESVGIVPDQWVDFDKLKFMGGKDVQLEAAIKYLDSGHTF